MEIKILVHWHLASGNSIKQLSLLVFAYAKLSHNLKTIFRENCSNPDLEPNSKQSRWMKTLIHKNFH